MLGVTRGRGMEEAKMHLRSPEECSTIRLIGGGDEVQRAEGTGFQRSLYLILKFRLGTFPKLLTGNSQEGTELPLPGYLMCVCYALYSHTLSPEQG